MKKFIFPIMACILMLFMQGCRDKFGTDNYTRIVNSKTLLGKPYHSIEIKNDSLTLKMEYNGKIKFNAARTMIRSISKGGYVSYSSNEKRLHAVPVTGGIKYELSDDEGVVALNKTGKKLISQAVKDMIYLDSLKNSLKN